MSSLPFSKRQSAAAIVFRSLFANQQAQTFLVFGTLVPPQVAPNSYTTNIYPFNNFYGFTGNSAQLNQLNLIYGNLYMQYIVITQQPFLQYFQVTPTPDENDSTLDAAIASALVSLQAMNVLVQAFTASTVNGNSNQPDLSRLQTLVANLYGALITVNSAGDDE